jgi:hypothetical protein
VAEESCDLLQHEAIDERERVPEDVTAMVRETT